MTEEFPALCAFICSLALLSHLAQFWHYPRVQHRTLAYTAGTIQERETPGLQAVNNYVANFLSAEEEPSVFLLSKSTRPLKGVE